MALVENETSDKVVDYVMTLKVEAKFDIPEVVFDNAHTNGKENIDKNSKKLFKGIIVRFSTFRHRSKFYRSRS